MSLQQKRLSQFKGIYPNSARSEGFFSWIRLPILGEEECFMVYGTGTIQTDDEQIVGYSPIKYCASAEEAIALVNRLNEALGAKDYNRRPRWGCPSCKGIEAVESPRDWEQGRMRWLCACGFEYQTNKSGVVS
jgi:hypothetical protein